MKIVTLNILFNHDRLRKIFLNSNYFSGNIDLISDCISILWVFLWLPNIHCPLFFRTEYIIDVSSSMEDIQMCFLFEICFMLYSQQSFCRWNPKAQGLCNIFSINWSVCNRTETWPEAHLLSKSISFPFPTLMSHKDLLRVIGIFWVFQTPHCYYWMLKTTLLGS